MGEIIETMKAIRRKFEAQVEIQMAERQIRTLIGNIPWIDVLVTKNVAQGIFPDSDIEKIDKFISSLKAVKAKLDIACETLEINPTNNLEMPYYMRLGEAIKEFEEMLTSINKLRADGSLWAS